MSLPPESEKPKKSQDSLGPGDGAPNFSLPTLKGDRADLSVLNPERNVLLWFSRGFQCTFCRNHMTEFTLGYRKILDTGTELIQISPNLASSARKFFGSDLPAFPFVCDPDKRLYAVYGLGDRGALSAAKNAVVTLSTSVKRGETMQTIRGSYLDIANRNFFRRLHHHAATAVEHGLFLIDRRGIIRQKIIVGPIDPIPKVDEMLANVEALCAKNG